MLVAVGSLISGGCVAPWDKGIVVGIWAAATAHASAARRGGEHTHWLPSPDRDKFHWTIQRTVKVTKRSLREAPWAKLPMTN